VELEASRGYFNVAKMSCFTLPSCMFCGYFECLATRLAVKSDNRISPKTEDYI
jgi:hypothetical protein